CQCDIGGSLTTMCSGPSGECQCREHVVGKECQRPENNHYFPDLHHMKHEVEDGAGPNGRDLQFGFDPMVFPEFSWRGYALMTMVQNEVRIRLTVRRSNLSLFHIILRYINPGTEEVSGRITVYPSWAQSDASQSKEITFPPSKGPAFVTVPGNGFAEPFSMTPGTWITCIQVEGVLLVELRLRLRVTQIGHYVIMLEYATEVDQLFVVDVSLESPGSALAGQVNVYSCKYSILCRSVVIDSLRRTAVYELLADADIELKVHMAKFLLVRVLVVPAENYDYQILHKTSMDKSSEFISNCGGDSFYIDPHAASRFCKNSARSLVAFYHNGALPCECHPVGATSRHCSPDGGQCPCRPNVIGRQCTRCATGHYGFPHCKPCNCGRRLCEEVTGKCLCPPRTVRPECEVCEKNSFNFHPLAGCEVCNCSRKGTIEAAISECDRDSGQCRAFPSEVTLPKESSLFTVQGNFRHSGSSAPVSREELMTVLSQLEGLYIRGLHFTETQRLTLGEVGLEESSDTGSGPRAHLVEMCACPPDYTGDSCQLQNLFKSSHSLSSPVRALWWHIENCQHNTAGEHCEHCKEGHYGNAIHGSCRVCPCPHTNSFATGCTVDGGNVRCACKPGYTGTQCERCAPGYFGNPQRFGGSCQPCKCNSNGQLGTCDPLTGDCVSQEPKDGSPAEECDDCDSCVMTLLNDLATMGEDLRLVESKLQGLSVSAGVLEQIRHVETQAKDLRSQLLGFRSALSSHGSKMDGLEKELSHLNLEFKTVQEKAQVNSRKAQTLYNNIDQTTQSAKELDTKIKNVIQNVHILLKQIARPGGEGVDVQVGDWSRELAEAQRMIHELRGRDFRKHLREAEAEKTEAQRLLSRIRAWLEGHQVENNGLLRNIRDSLNDYEAKLQDLSAVLQEATVQGKQATGLNRDNEGALGAIQRQMKEMNSLKNDFTKYLATADSSLLQTNTLLQQMDKSQKEYESLAVALNGARQELNNKVQELSRSASKAPLVVEAEKHAQSLQELAKQLEEIKRNTSGDELVRCAVDAATAYENILNAIRAAEDAANRATSASESALQTLIKEDLPRRAKTLSSESDGLLNEARTTQKKLQQEVSPALNSLQQTLNTVSVQKGLLDVNLTAVRDGLRGLRRGDADNMISGAKNMVRKANGITSELLDGLNPIQTDLGRIKDSYGSTRSEDFNKALTDANNSVKKLTKKLPDLFIKIESINEQLLPLGNISDNVDRIRELIQQARDAANKVAVPMRFNGKSGVEVRLPNDLEDLKGYTSLSLFLQRPDLRENGGTEDMFVMYLGNKDASKDYIGMAVVDGQLTCVYNLGDREAEVQVDQVLTESENQEAVMDRVKFQRIYQLAKLNYTKEATSNKPKAPGVYDMEGDSSSTLLNLDPETAVFYVGGYPPDFQLPSRLRFPPYKGCIELDDLNENVMSLYNFKTTFNLNTTEVEPCRRRKEESDRNYFEGTGYARIPTQANAPFPNFIQTIQTTVDRGLLFFAENQDNFISLDIEDGNLMVRYKLDSELPKEKGIQDTINNGRDHM
ncbi:hypothetical protein STEG23_034897, partial [Scotinomys teguina]